MSPAPSNKSLGFTLIEVLVALAVFAVMAAMAYKGLEQMNSIKAHLDQEMRFWRELTLVMDRLESDIQQQAPRNWIDAAGAAQPPLKLGDADGARKLEFIRLDGQRAPFHMAYVWRDKTLQLMIWPQIDLQADGKNKIEPQVHTLLQDVVQFEVALLDKKNHWQNTWPYGDDGQGRPRGMRIKLKFADRGEFERVVAIP